MASVPKTGKSWNPRERSQLRHDRITAVIVLVAIVALMALMMWLASLGEAPPSDYWPMMP